MLADDVDFFKSNAPDWGPPSLLYNGYRVFPGGGRGMVLTPQPHLQCRGLKLGRAIPLSALRALVACYGEHQPLSICVVIPSNYHFP